MEPYPAIWCSCVITVSMEVKFPEPSRGRIGGEQVAYSGVLEDVRTCVGLGVPSRVPVFADSEMFDVRMGGVSYPEYSRDAEQMARCRIEAVKHLDYDWSCGWPDDYVEFESFGVKLKGEECVPLSAYEWPPASRETLKALKIPDFHREGRMPVYLEVLSRIKQEFGDTICLTGRVAGPFGAVSLLHGIEPGLALLNEDPELFRETSGFLLELAVAWGTEQIRAGADALWLGDCVACSGFISPNHYTEFAAEGAFKASETLKKEGAFVFYHAGEESLPRLRLMAAAEPSALSVGEGADIAEVKEALGDRVCLIGNIDGIGVVGRGTTAEVERETARIMEAGKKGGGYIFNSGEGIPYEAPEENMRAMIRTARKHGVYSA